MNREQEFGFTLIELVVVITIISILTAMIVPSVVSRVKMAKEKRVEADVASIATAERLYFVDNDEWADNLGELGEYGVSGAIDPWGVDYSLSLSIPGEPDSELTIGTGDNGHYSYSLTLKFP